MNAWYMLAAYVGAILICLALCAVSLAVMMHGIVKQRRLGGKRYGEPDINMYTPGRGGSLWYYIYTDEGPIMPDHLEHFYRIGIDENGRAAEISDTVRKGG